MNLRPKSDTKFKTKEHWDKFVLERKEAFELHGDYFELSIVLHKYSKVKDDILLLGCGNSRLSEDLYDLGYHGLVNIDSSDVVIKEMKDRNKKKRPEMQFIKMDMLKMTFQDEQFNVVIDKGLLKTMFVTNQGDSAASDVNQMFCEVQRVLKTNGRFICITPAVQENILDQLLSYFSNGWFIRVHYVETMSSLPVFAFIFTKTKFVGCDSGSFPKILEICFNGTDEIQRVGSVDEMKTAINSKQEYAIIKQYLRKFDPQNSFSLELWGTEGYREPRYTLIVVDSQPFKDQNGLYAIFIVPQGRETEPSFNTDEGRRELAATARFQRLVVVTLHRGHEYENLDKIKQELSVKAMDLAPDGITDENLVPFLSAGGDIGIRDTLEKGHSQQSGDYVIEEVFGEVGEKKRRLVFLDSPSVIQSEVCIRTAYVAGGVWLVITGYWATCGTETTEVKGKKGKTKQKTEVTVDHGYLLGLHLQGLAAGLAFVDGLLKKDAKKHGLLIGLGGGCLPMFIHEFYPQVALDVVEIDSEIVKVAEKWFDCKEDERLKIITSDGLEYIKNKAIDNDSIYDIIMFDVNDSGNTSGLLGPTLSFLDIEFLNNVKTILNKQGVLGVDFICQNTELRAKVLGDIQSVFNKVFTVKIPDLANEVIFALPAMEEKQLKLSAIQKTVRDLQKFGEASKGWNDDMDLCDIMLDLNIV